MRWRRRSLAVVTLLVVIVGAVVLATAAGARRSATALARFDSYSRASTIELDVDATTPSAQIARFARTSGVLAVAPLHAYAQQVEGRPDLQIAAAVDGRLGSVLDRPRLIAGRRPDPNSRDEITISEPLARLAHVRIGDSLVADSLTPTQIGAAEHGTDPGPPLGPRVRLRVVGFVRRPLDLGDRAASGGVVLLTPAFDRAYQGRIGTFTTVLRVRTSPSAAVKAKVEAAAQKEFGASPFFQATDLSRENGGAASAIDIVTLALWIFAGVSALAGAIAIGVVISREVSQSAHDHPTLQALGATRATRVAITMMPACAVTAIGVLGASLVAVLASPLFPIGISRRADPDPGFHVDWVALAVGTVALLLIVLGIALVAAVRSSRVVHESRAARAGRPWLSERFAHAGLAPSFTNGVRMTFEHQPGDRTLPTRSAFAGAVAGVAGIVAVVLLATSLGHLVSTPRLYGWTFDFKAPDDTFAITCGRRDRTDFGLHRVPGVDAVAAACFGNVRIDGRASTGWALTPVLGSIGPEVVAGRAPQRAGEVALGSATLHALGKHVGDTVRVGEERPARPYRIVGQVVFPRLYGGELQPLADGAMFTTAGFRPLAADNQNLNRYLVGRFSAGADHRAVLAHVSRMAAFHPVAGHNALISDAGAHTASAPPEITRLRDVGWFAPVLGALLALLALVAVGHALVTAVRRRRHEFAVLKTLGFRRRQVQATVAWHATLLALVGVVVGVPLGVVAGRFAWKLLADQLGVSTVTWFPFVAPLLMIAGVLAVVNLLAFLPARAAASTRPAVALRAE
jgi:ABC-type lipoprotein release transport system permease subunit